MISQPMRASLSIVSRGFGNSTRGVGCGSKNSVARDVLCLSDSDDEIVVTIAVLDSGAWIRDRGFASLRHNLVAVRGSVGQVVKICG